jgi:hypothetical protein
MVSRFGARLLTGSTAFLIGGLLDLGAHALTALAARARRRSG